LNNELDEEKKKLNNIENSMITQLADITKKYQAAKDNIEQQLEETKSSYNTRKAEWIIANQQSVDLAARLEALSNISHFSLNPVGDNFLGNTIWRASLLITLLFIALETAPVVVKLLTPRGDYDEILDRVEYENKIEQKKIISCKNSEVNELLIEYDELAKELAKIKRDVQIQITKKEVDEKLKTNNMILDSIAKKQQELALAALEEWYRDKKADVKSVIPQGGV
jgi:hypothetical protein